MLSRCANEFGLARVARPSGEEWARTRKTGVNTLAFRGAQHGAFYTADADFVGVTNAIPSSLNRQWLDLLARSGTMLFVSLAPDALGADRRCDLRAALALAAARSRSVDWLRSTFPAQWRLGRVATLRLVGRRAVAAGATARPFRAGRDGPRD